jgi:hypothetical protein
MYGFGARKKAPFTKLLGRAEAQHRTAVASFEQLGGPKVLDLTNAAPGRV